ncbi:MAG: sugar ABC transporter permease [Actinomycetota bacterium]|nr:sugar ABC transporter permease [Actinomycetota bacterium]
MAYPFVAPVVVLTIIFSVLPLVLVVRRSLYAGNVFGTDLRFAGLSNYGSIFADGGGQALLVTVIYTVGFVVVTTACGLGIALLLDVSLRGTGWTRALFIIPVVVPPVATAFIWYTFFQPNTGFINRILIPLGLPQVSLSGPRVAMLAIITFGAWQFIGEVVILFLAGLKSLPGELLEAATVDGAGALSRFRHIRWPLLRHSTALISVVATLTGLQAFTQIYILTGGGPSGWTQTVLYYVYQEGFGLGGGGSTGEADAMAVILFLISIVVALVQLRVIGRAVRQES